MHANEKVPQQLKKHISLKECEPWIYCCTRCEYEKRCVWLKIRASRVSLMLQKLNVHEGSFHAQSKQDEDG